MNEPREDKPGRYGDDWLPIPAADPFARSTSVLRLGAAAELGAAPLVRGLASLGGVSFEARMPGPLAARFEAETLDCALLPVLDCAQSPLYKMVPGIGLCTLGRTQTEMLFARDEPQALRRVAIPPEAGRAAGLARVVMGDVFGSRPVFVSAVPETFDPAAFDGIVTSGDFAWTYANPWPLAFDLGELWRGLTGLPLVRLMWATRRNAPLPRLRMLLSRALQQGLSELRAISEEAAARGVASAETANAYLERTAYYAVGGQELEAAAELLRRAAKYGLCSPDAAIELC